MKTKKLPKAPTSREGWLKKMVRALRPTFKGARHPIPAVVRVSVGWPGIGGARGKSVGECWDPQCAQDSAPHIFISPRLDQTKALGTLVHELLHASLFCTHPDKRKADGKHSVGHGALFKKGMDALGLVGKATHAEPGPALAKEVASLAAKLGPYPHAILTPREKPKKDKVTRFLACACVPRRILRGSVEDLKRCKTNCEGCGKPMKLKKKTVKAGEA